MRHALHLQRKRQEYLQPIQTQITTNLLAKYALWSAAAGFASASGMAVYSTLAALLNSGDHIVSSSSVLVQRIRCLLIIFKMEHTNLVF
jgi:cystathionine beta-lyase/cystathionine gamma-synthase